MTDDATKPARPLRRDAERNRKRIIVAAREVFTIRGLDASLDEVARHAGVGVGTVYRRFADKEALVDALFADRVDELAAIAERWLAEPDPWLALVSFLHEWVAEQAGDLGLRQMLMLAAYGGASRFSLARMRFAPLVGALVNRAKAAGLVRADLEPTDVPFIALMLCTAAEYAQDSAPEIWRRYLTVFIDGISVTRDCTTPLPVDALPAAQIEEAIRKRATARANAKPDDAILEPAAIPVRYQAFPE